MECTKYRKLEFASVELMKNSLFGTEVASEQNGAKCTEDMYVVESRGLLQSPKPKDSLPTLALRLRNDCGHLRQHINRSDLFFPR
jgi:hypothetical protein